MGLPRIAGCRLSFWIVEWSESNESGNRFHESARIPILIQTHFAETNNR